MQVLRIYAMCVENNTRISWLVSVVQVRKEHFNALSNEMTLQR